MKAFCDEHPAPIVQADFVRGILGKTFHGAEAVIDHTFVPHLWAMDRR